MKLTKSQRRHLEFVRDNEPASLFPAGIHLWMIMRCKLLGFVEECAGGQSAFGPFRFTAYRLTDSGRRALQDKS